MRFLRLRRVGELCAADPSIRAPNFSVIDESPRTRRAHPWVRLRAPKPTLHRRAACIWHPGERTPTQLVECPPFEMGENSCQWIVPATPTTHARIRMSVGVPGPPDPGHPELEFTITGPVVAPATSWTTVKSRYSN